MKMMGSRAITGLFQRFFCPSPKAAPDATLLIDELFDGITVNLGRKNVTTQVPAK
jgi:hypothetical protein